MRKFIFKTLLFTVPFLALYLITSLFYSTKETPDLLRLGYIPDIYQDYREAFDFSKPKKYELLSKSKHRKFEILTIGDSFSEQGAIGYKNELANDFTVLHVNRFISDNQIQTLMNLVNGDFFETYKINYVVLQNVERYIIDNSENIDSNGKLTIKDVDTLVTNAKPKKEVFKYDFFSSATLKFPLSSTLFFIKENYLSNKQVYNVQLNTKSLFSNNSDKLLFFYQDFTQTNKNNLVENSEKLNAILNAISGKLKQKNIKLIVLPSPDKYDMYYDYIVDKKSFTKPLFFENFKKLKKDYIYIDSKEILSEKLKTQKDIYFYDDTHWSPIASKLIANEIKNSIKKAP
ncbi:acetyltransferase AlgX (SGNH hydrolase-like protein) [Flavobacterium sp. 90]|uniref:alginate O-acetyltransferase AlgX-related protein n=1 Tax=unclassified Flavobacterium TaxID=196869 RepID=UPI000EADD171|nr:MULTISPECIES: hypothetical protein [unclassified Flavobacterium]RKR05364.1 acetyltransferase AlgX (SGNH hydrolase-like protein) [Flavobacterium sp. 81]TCK56679.1 acetyltransferase AlgX (SGNH hydrolase-like protein) [Flavobacterium sp. 90]